MCLPASVAAWLHSSWWFWVGSRWFWVGRSHSFFLDFKASCGGLGNPTHLSTSRSEALSVAIYETGTEQKTKERERLFYPATHFPKEIKQMRYFRAGGCGLNKVKPQLTVRTECYFISLSHLIKADPEETRLQTVSGNQSGMFGLHRSKQQHSLCQRADWFTPLWGFNPHN